MTKLAPVHVSILIGTCLFTSCATLLAPKTSPVSLNSRPVGADIYMNSNKMGTTPLVLNLKPDKPYVIEFRKEGYESVPKVINSSVRAGWVILDVLMAVIPAVVDAYTQAWNKLDKQSIRVVLREKKK